MDTTTRKQEALELLALDKLDKHQVARLEVLTCLQTGNDEDCWRDYCDSVDACLALPLPDGCWWLMTSRAPDTRCSAAIVLERHRQYAATIPLAMMKAWWSMQP